MAQDRGSVGLGVKLKMGNGASPETFTTLAEVVDFNGPNLKLNTTDSTHYQDTWMGKKPTLLDAGTATFTCNFIPTDATQGLSTGFLVNMFNKTLVDWQVQWTDGSLTTWQFQAYVTDFQPKAPINGMLRASITLTLEGVPAFV